MTPDIFAERRLSACTELPLHHNLMLLKVHLLLALLLRPYGCLYLLLLHNCRLFIRFCLRKHILESHDDMSINRIIWSKMVCRGELLADLPWLSFRFQCSASARFWLLLVHPSHRVASDWRLSRWMQGMILMSPRPLPSPLFALRIPWQKCFI